MGPNLNKLVNTDQPTSPAADERVVDSVSSRTEPRGLSLLLEEETEDEVDKGGPLLGEVKKSTMLKTFPSGIGGPRVSEGHHDVSPPLGPFFGTLGEANTFGDANIAGKGPMGDRPDSP